MRQQQLDIPLGRMYERVFKKNTAAFMLHLFSGSPRDISNATLFIAGDKAGYITGACLDVNGGAFI